MKHIITKYLIAVSLVLTVAMVEVRAQAIGIQMGSMRKMFSEGMPAVIAKLKELGVTEIEGGGGGGRTFQSRPRPRTVIRRSGMRATRSESTARLRSR